MKKPPHEISLRFRPDLADATAWHAALAEMGLKPNEYTLFLPTPEADGAILIDEPLPLLDSLFMAKLAFS